ncbi:unnamed protein product [Thelazia callipaeda]|uniref:GCS light chain n=1 Tax=Thelazia callipaeda TaxID=103827 RepID=A0A0N5D3F6_THECL|nr:unnamed protein product [Thelazia callipaeda]
MCTGAQISSKDIISKIQKSDTVLINTGNIQRHSELFRRMFKNSAEELVAAVEFELEGPNGPDLALGEDGTVQLTRDSQKCHLNTIERNDMKTTLKVFMSSLDIQQVEESVNAALQAINIKSLSQLIIAFPPEDKFVMTSCTPDSVQQWLRKISPFWKSLGNLVKSQKVNSLGVADLDYEQLKALYESTDEYRPMIDHYNTEHCCTVPPELREYARQKDIQLLTHNDPNLCTIDDKLGIASRKLFGSEKFSLELTARLTVWLRSRSIIVGKIYMLKFRKNKY